MDYIDVRAGLAIGRSPEGTTWTEKRLYDSSDLESVLANLPPQNTPHPSIPFAVLLNVSVTLAEAKDKSFATLSYGPRTVTQQQRPATNSAGETWEWMMVSQMMHITTVIGLSNWAFVPHVREWNHMTDPIREDTEGPEISTGIRKSDSGFEGLELYRPTGALRVSKQFAYKDDVDKTFRTTIYGLQAKVNLAEWVDWGEQEVLFIGANIRKGSSDATIDYHFLFGRTEESPKFRIMKLDSTTEDMDEIEVSTGIYPFQAVWQEQAPKSFRPAAGENGQSKKPMQAINLKVADVYDLIDFTALGLTSPDED